MELKILGISASHNASACLLINNEIVSAIELERITRIKYDGVGYLDSEEAINYCLDAIGLNPRDIDYFAFNNQPLLPNYCGLSQPVHSEKFSAFDPFSEKSFYVSHHLAHAYSAFCTSGFKDSIVIVADGSGGSTVGENDLILSGGEFEKYLQVDHEEKPLLQVVSIYHFNESGYELLDREFAPSFNIRCGSSSLGETYASVSQYIFGNWLDGGKLMGLAPYGSASSYGNSLLDHNKLNFSKRWKLFHNDLTKDKDPFKLADLAARIQLDFEDAILNRIKLVKSKTKIKHLCYAGGLALNCVANERIYNESGFNDIFIFPASNDAGISIGAAFAAQSSICNKKNILPITSKRIKHVYWGKRYENYEYASIINKYSDYLDCEEISEKQIAELLYQNKILGYFMGASEFGPRALGHRSILASPSKRETWNFINKRIKFREDFRPFAPIVPHEVAKKYFEIIDESPFMLRVVKVKEEFRELLQAVTHVNGTARVQTINTEVNSKLCTVLNEFYKLSGVPILINTSLNVRGQPIVEKPEEAIKLLLSTHLDGLIFENLLLTPKRKIINEQSVFLFAPDITIRNQLQNELGQMSLVSDIGRFQEVRLNDWQYEGLTLAFKKLTYNDIINTLKSSSKDGNEIKFNKWIRNLLTLRILYID